MASIEIFLMETVERTIVLSSVAHGKLGSVSQGFQCFNIFEILVIDKRKTGKV